jgi:hypothetical protein
VSNVDGVFKTKIVQLILSNDAEMALRSLAEHYDVDVPSLRVGLIRGHVKVAGCYVVKNKTIYVASSDGLVDPFLILHEFYHHLRSASGSHRGAERYANTFARSYIDDFTKQARPVS